MRFAGIVTILSAAVGSACMQPTVDYIGRQSSASGKITRAERGQVTMDVTIAANVIEERRDGPTRSRLLGTLSFATGAGGAWSLTMSDEQGQLGESSGQNVAIAVWDYFDDCAPDLDCEHRITLDWTPGPSAPLPARWSLVAGYHGESIGEDPDITVVPIQ